MLFLQTTYTAIILGCVCSFLLCWFLPSMVKQYFTSNILKEVLQNIPYTEDNQTVFTYVANFLRKNTGVKDIHFLFNNDNENFRSVFTTSKTYSYPPITTSLFFKYLSQRSPVLFTNSLLEKNNKEVYDYLMSYNATSCMVIHHDGELLGLIILGQKETKKGYGIDSQSTLNEIYSHMYVFMCYLKYIALQPLASVSSNNVLFSAEVIQSVYNNVDPINHSNAESAIFISSIKKLHGAYVDFIAVDENRYIVILGDFCKHGLSTCMSVVILKTMVRLFATQTDNIQELVQKTYSFFAKNLPEQHVFSGLFMLVDFEKQTLAYTCFGIETFLLYSQDSEKMYTPKRLSTALQLKNGVYIPEVTQVSLDEATVLIASTGEFHPDLTAANVLKEKKPAAEILKKLYNAYVITDHVMNEDSCSVLIKIKNNRT